MPISLLSQSFPPSAFTESDIPDLSGKVAIVTGGNTGIGKETARALLQHNCKVYIACRSEEKAHVAIESLKTNTGKTDADVKFLKLDLGNIKASKAAAEEFIKEEELLHLLFNNAGVMVPPKGSLTSDGYDLQWGTNVLGHFIFTETLLPLLRKTAAASPAGSVRIVTTSSSAHTFAPKGGINLEDQTWPGQSNGALYGQSKLGDVFIAVYWAEKLKADGIISLTLNPGNIQSDLQRSLGSIVRWLMNTLLLYPTPQGAITQLFGATSPSITIENTGAFLVPWARIDVPARREVNDLEFRAKVIAVIEKQIAAKL